MVLLWSHIRIDVSNFLDITETLPSQQRLALVTSNGSALSNLVSDLHSKTFGFCDQYGGILVIDDLVYDSLK